MRTRQQIRLELANMPELLIFNTTADGCVRGVVSGSKDFVDGDIIKTSPVVSVDTEHRIVHTRRSRYRYASDAWIDNISIEHCVEWNVGLTAAQAAKWL